MASAAMKTGQVVRRWPVLAEAFAGEGRAWLFVFKTLLALYLAAWLQKLQARPAYRKAVERGGEYAFAK